MVAQLAFKTNRRRPALATSVFLFEAGRPSVGLLEKEKL